MIFKIIKKIVATGLYNIKNEAARSTNVCKLFGITIIVLNLLTVTRHELNI